MTALSPLSPRTRSEFSLPEFLALDEPFLRKARRLLFALEPGEVAGLLFVAIAVTADLIVGGPTLEFLRQLMVGIIAVMVAWVGVGAILRRVLPPFTRPEAMRTLRSCVGLTLSLITYSALPAVIDYVQPFLWDETLLKIEMVMLQSLTGGVPLYRVLYEVSTPALTAWFSFAYALQAPFYYVTAVALALQRRYRLARQTFLTMTLTQYVGFVGYMIWPTLGPGVYFADGPLPPLEETIVSVVVGAYGVARGTFPSLHAAISLIVLIVVWRHLRQLLWLMLPLVVSLWISTLYLRHHYLPDLIAGWALAVAIVVITPRLLAWWETRQRAELPRAWRPVLARPELARPRRRAGLPSPAGGGSPGSSA